MNITEIYTVEHYRNGFKHLIEEDCYTHLRGIAFNEIGFLMDYYKEGKYTKDETFKLIENILTGLKIAQDEFEQHIDELLQTLD